MMMMMMMKTLPNEEFLEELLRMYVKQREEVDRERQLDEQDKMNSKMMQQLQRDLIVF